MFKKLFRMIIFSGLSIIAISLLIKGFSVDFSLKPFLLTSVSLGVFYYLINPVMRAVLLPINFLTLGIVSFVVYIILFSLVVTKLGFIIIESWTFTGGSYLGFNIPTIQFTYLMTLIIVSILYSFFINMLEFFL